MKVNKKGKIIIVSIILILCLISCVIATYVFGMTKRTTNPVFLKDASRQQRWLADLNFVKKELPKQHKNLFFSMTKTDFNNEMDMLIKNIGKYDDMKLKGELARIINGVNDSHTYVDIRGTLAYPVSFFEFEEGIYLTNTSMEYKDFWGKKLVAINGYSIEQLHTKLDAFVSHDNEAITKNQFCNSFKYVETLEIAGVSENGKTVFTFEDGTSIDITISPVEADKYKKMKTLTDTPEYLSKFPISSQNMNKNYWFDVNPVTNTIYVKYNACSNTSGYSFDSFTNDVFDAIDHNKAKTLIIDLRDNGGGNSSIFDPFMEAIKAHEAINTKENLFVIVGRKTFSSAVLNAMDLRNKTNATLIGEPSGGKPNHFGEVKKMHLPNVNIDVYYSSNYFKTSKEETDAIYPDVNVPTTASSYFSGKDACLEYIYLKIQ